MFKHPEQALRFAYKMREKSIISRPSGVYQEKINMPSPDKRTLTAFDFHAQAGMIFSFLDRQSDVEQAFCLLHYGTPIERKVGARYLSSHIPLPTALSDRHQLRKALMGNSVRRVANDVGISNYKAWKLRKELWGSLEPIMLKLYSSLGRWAGLEGYA